MRSIVPLFVMAALGCGGSAGDAPKAPSASENKPAPTPVVGSKAPTFELRSVNNGTPMKIVPGHVNVVLFWATWSMPDVQQLSRMESVWKKLGPRGLVIDALSIDDESKGVAECAKTRGVTYDIGWDEAHRIAERYRPGTDPTTYIIDKSGVIRFIHSGYHDGEAEVIEHDIESLL